MLVESVNPQLFTWKLVLFLVDRALTPGHAGPLDTLKVADRAVVLPTLTVLAKITRESVEQHVIRKNLMSDI